MNEQEKAWSGEFGNEYTKRNQGAEILASKIALFSKVLARVDNVETVMEFGANTGLNLQAVKFLLPNTQVTGVELNPQATETMKKVTDSAINASMFDKDCWGVFDLVFLRGVLIHIPPERLQQAYKTIYTSSRRYICLIEYYNPTPVEVEYRGMNNMLWKRDFAGEMLDRFPLELVDYGFVYHRDPFPQDDVHWWVMRK